MIFLSYQLLDGYQGFSSCSSITFLTGDFLFSLVPLEDLIIVQINGYQSSSRKSENKKF
jgi:hypothetical protein